MDTATKQQKKVPELRFPEFRDDWQSSNFKNKLKVIDGDRGTNYPKATDFSPEGHCVFLSAKNVTKGGFLFKELSFITEKKENALRNGKLIRGDIVLTTRGSLGHIALYDESVPFEHLRINSGMVLLRVNESADAKFTYLFLRSPIAQNQVKRLSFGSAQPQLTVRDIKAVKISLPSVTEQQKIADFLGSVDAWLDNLRQQKTTLETYKRGMLQKLFTQQVRFKDDDGNDFPEWITTKLGDLGEVKTSSVDKVSNEGEVDVNLLNYMDVYRRDHIHNTDEFQIVTATDRERTSFSLQQGDILFTPSSETPTDIGHSAVVMEDLDNVLYSYHLLRFRPRSGELNGGFGGYAFKSFNFYKELWRRAQGATRYTLSLESMKQVEVTYPASSDEQGKITNFLTAIDQTITAKAEEITQVEEWKRGLMQKMFV